MKKFNVYYLRHILVSWLGWMVLGSYSMSYGAESYGSDLRLFQAVKQGNIEEVRALLSSNISRDFIVQVNDHGQTVLHIASATDQIDMVKLLLEEVGFVGTEDVVLEFMTKQDKAGYTAGRIASEEGHVDVVAALLDRYGLILHPAASVPESAIITRAYYDVGTFLFYAAQKGKVNVVSLWLSKLPKGVMQPIDAKGGWTPLHFGSDNGYADVVKTLLAQDEITAYMMQADGYGWTALHLASYNGNLEVVKAILEALLEKDEIAEYIMRADRHGWTALHFAAQNGHTEVVSAILEALLAKHEISEYMMQVDCYGRTALHVAALYGHVEVVNVLLEAWLAENETAGRITQAVDHNGWASLHLASFSGHIGVVESLVSAAPIVLWQKTESGASALDIARDRGISMVVDYLTKEIIASGVMFNP